MITDFNNLESSDAYRDATTLEMVKYTNKSTKKVSQSPTDTMINNSHNSDLNASPSAEAIRNVANLNEGQIRVIQLSNRPISNYGDIAGRSPSAPLEDSMHVQPTSSADMLPESDPSCLNENNVKERLPIAESSSIALCTSNEIGNASVENEQNNDVLSPLLLPISTTKPDETMHNMVSKRTASDAQSCEEETPRKVSHVNNDDSDQMQVIFQNIGSNTPKISSQREVKRNRVITDMFRSQSEGSRKETYSPLTTIKVPISRAQSFPVESSSTLVMEQGNENNESIYVSEVQSTGNKSISLNVDPHQVTNSITQPERVIEEEIEGESPSLNCKTS